MTFYNRYLAGETVQVYTDIFELGQKAFESDAIQDIDKVLTETFNRVSSNIHIIYSELQKINYQFRTSFKYNFERPLHPPLPDTYELLTKLNSTVMPFGYVPLSLQYFYRIVGAVNFEWDYNANEDIMWEMSDPLQIMSLNDLVSVVLDEDWSAIMVERREDELGPDLILASDVYHKDNVSGGGPYALQLTREPSIDSFFINEPNQTTFINYLRICFDHCGFPGMNVSDNVNGFLTFFEKVYPMLKKI